MQVASNVTRVNIKITSTKLYFPIAALWKNNDIASLENLKQARIKKKNKFRKKLWNKYRSKMTTQPKEQITLQDGVNI